MISYAGAASLLSQVQRVLRDHPTAREVVTTNYDGLYEQACTHARLRVSTLPGDSLASIEKSDRVLVKLHGDLGSNHTPSKLASRVVFCSCDKAEMT